MRTPLLIGTRISSAMVPRMQWAISGSVGLVSKYIRSHSTMNSIIMNREYYYWSKVALRIQVAVVFWAGCFLHLQF